MNKHPEIEKKILAAYDEVPAYIKEDIEDAIVWAKDKLMRHEGEGHDIYVTAAGTRAPNQVVCSFAKPQWPGDHCSRPMDHAAEAIVMAVCEYLNGG